MGTSPSLCRCAEAPGHTGLEAAKGFRTTLGLARPVAMEGFPWLRSLVDCREWRDSGGKLLPGQSSGHRRTVMMLSKGDLSAGPCAQRVATLRSKP
jgi:hypothetical protein